mgnify:CR=1 FL=1
MTFAPNPGQQRALDDVLTTGKRFCLLYGGSRSGKTALLTACTIDRALAAANSRHLIVRKEATAAKRAIAKDTLPKVWRLKYPGTPAPEWKDQLGYFILPNGSEIWIGGLNDEKAMERILGNEYATIYVNEASEVSYSAFLLLRSRLAQVAPRLDGADLSQRFYCDLNPTTRVHWTYRLWIDGTDPQDEKPVDREKYGFCVINPYDNAQNLSAEYLVDLRALPEKQRKRFLDGEYTADDDNALWRRSFFRRVQPKPGSEKPEGIDLLRIVVAIDPAVTATAGSDETGIIAAALGSDGRGYVLADESGKYRPEEWAQRALSLYRSLGADRIVGEVNQGGDMVEATIRAQDANASYKAVRASRGKITRAEPVAALYERNKVFHVGEFPALEDQLCSVTPAMDRKTVGWSPDRMDALVWAMTDLFPDLAAQQVQSGPLPVPQFSRV